MGLTPGGKEGADLRDGSIEGFQMTTMVEGGTNFY